MHHYVAPRLTRQIPNEILTCLEAGSLLLPSPPDGFSGAVAREFMGQLADRGRLSYVNRPDAEKRDDLRQLVAYVVLRRGEEVLTYRRGHFSAAHPMLRGSLCLGFGGHVQEQDTVDLFSVDGGICMAADREVREELDGLDSLSFEPVGVINDQTSPEGTRHIGVVVEAVLPSDFTEERSKRERAINELTLLPVEELVERYHELEYWSQLVVKYHLRPSSSLERCVSRPEYGPKATAVVAVVGEIAVGKTTVCTTMVESLGFRLVSTRECVATLAGATDFGTGDREEFQSEAQKLVSSPEGCEQLAREILRQVEGGPKPVVVDGIRHVETYERLRELCQEPIALLSVETSRDLALRNFTSRGSKGNVDEFRRARFHSVESEIPILRQEADAHIFNGGSPAELLDTLRRWYQT